MVSGVKKASRTARRSSAKSQLTTHGAPEGAGHVAEHGTSKPSGPCPGSYEQKPWWETCNLHFFLRAEHAGSLAGAVPRWLLLNAQHPGKRVGMRESVAAAVD